MSIIEIERLCIRMIIKDVNMQSEILNEDLKQEKKLFNIECFSSKQIYSSACEIYQESKDQIIKNTKVIIEEMPEELKTKKIIEVQHFIENDLERLMNDNDESLLLIGNIETNIETQIRFIEETPVENLQKKKRVFR